MVVLDATVVNIALPSAQHDLGFNNADRQWVVTAYSLAFGGLLLLGGRLADLVGRKRMLIIGMVGFASPRPSAGPHRTSRCCSSPARSRARSARCWRRPPCPR